MVKYVLRVWVTLEKLDWNWLSKNPRAIHLLEQNPDKIDWNFLSMNSAAIHLLEKNFYKIYWWNLSRNPSIFMLKPRWLLENTLTRKEVRQFAWEYPRVYLKLRWFVEHVSRAVYDPSYKWCQRRLLKEFDSL